MKNFTANDFHGLQALNPLLDHTLLDKAEEQAIGLAMQQDLRHVQRVYSGYPMILKAFCRWARDEMKGSFHQEDEISLEQINQIETSIQRGDQAADVRTERQLHYHAQDVFQAMRLTYDGAMAIHRGVANAIEQGLGSKHPQLVNDYQFAQRWLDDWQKKSTQLIQHNLRLVFDLASNFAGNGMDVEDLFQEGVIGLKRGVEKWNVHLGLRFSTYAVQWIKQGLRRSIENKASTIRIPVHIHTRRRQGEDIFVPTTESLHTPLNSDDTEMGHLIEDETAVNPEDSLVSEDFSQTINRALESLDPEHSQLIRHRFGLQTTSMSRPELAASMGLTAKQLQSKERAAITALRDTLHEMGISADLLAA